MDEQTKPILNTLGPVPIPAPMNKEIFDKKWGGVDPWDLEEDKLTEMKEDAFQMYEQTGFSDTFHSPYDDDTYNHNGKPFKVLRRATEEECDLETLPVWLVEFEGEPEPFYCYPEEICKIEEK